MMIKGNNSQLNQIESYKKTWMYMYNVYLFKKKYIIIYVYINKIFMYDGHFRGPFQAEIQIVLSVVVRWFVPIDLDHFALYGLKLYHSFF